MTERNDGPPQADSPQVGDGALAPLPGEAGIPDVARAIPGKVSRKALVAFALLVLSLVVFSVLSIERTIASYRKPDDAASRHASDRPAIASGEPKRPDMEPVRVSPSASGASMLRVPAIVPTDEELADPTGVRRSGGALPAQPSVPATPAEDAPSVLISTHPATATKGRPLPGGAADLVEDDAADSRDALARTRRNLENYQRQLQSLLEASTRSPAGPATPPSEGTRTPAATTVGGPLPGGLFGGQLVASATPRVTAATLGHRSLVLPKGTAFTCALKTKLVSAASGLVGCQVQRNVYGDDGRVLLIERGSHLDGEYRATAVRPGTVRIPVVWTRLRTPNGVTVDIDSPGTGPLGESGIDGHVDNRWPERIGAALLLSVIDDSMQLAIQNESNGAGSNAVIFPSTTSTGSKLAEKVLDSTINLPPLIVQNQGAIVGIHVARDVDFSTVYELRPTVDGARP